MSTPLSHLDCSLQHHPRNGNSELLTSQYVAMYRIALSSVPHGLEAVREIVKGMVQYDMES